MRLIGSSGATTGYRARHGWQRKGRLAAASVVAAVTLTGTALVAPPPASASVTEQGIVTPLGLLSPVTSVLEFGGTVLQQFSLIDGVEAQVPTLLEPLLAALPGITVTPNASVTVQSTTPPPESTGPH